MNGRYAGRTMRSALSTCVLLTAAATAQMPHDHALVLETTTAFYVPNYRIVDLFGGGYTIVHNQNVYSLPSPVSVATDPMAPGHYFFQTNPSSLAGTWRQNLGMTATAQQAMWGPWQQGPASRVRVGTNQVFTLQNGLVRATARAGSGPITNILTVPGAIDLASIGSKLWVVANQAGTSPLIEFDLVTSVQRLVGTYSGARSLAVSPTQLEACLGLDNGQLQRIDIASGAVTSLQPGNPTSAPIIAVGYSRFATLAWADAQNAWSELTTGPIYTAAATIVDLGVGTATTASAVPFGMGCGLGSGSQWITAGLPTLGNANFQIGMSVWPFQPLAILALGTSRVQSSVLGSGLPFDLGLFGAPGCDLLVDPQTLLAYAAISSVQQPVPIPNTPALAGASFFAQLFVSSNQNALGLDGTPGLALTIQ